MADYTTMATIRMPAVPPLVFGLPVDLAGDKRGGGWVRVSGPKRTSGDASVSDAVRASGDAGVSKAECATGM